MNLKEIQEVIKMMEENDIYEFQLERNGFKITLKRNRKGEVVVPEAAPRQSAPPPKGSEMVEELGDAYKEILSPMVGTFYSAASPEASPFVQVGLYIGEGDIVCIVEAMKVMNEIKAEISGKIVEIFVENGQPVEFGQPLFKVE